MARDLTIGDVAAMEPRKALQYIYKTASPRVLELGKLNGDKMLRCLGKEFLGIKPTEGGNHIFPRGLKAAIKLIHRHNNNGGSHLSALEQINEIVDLVAQHACGLSKDSMNKE